MRRLQIRKSETGSTYPSLTSKGFDKVTHFACSIANFVSFNPSFTTKKLPYLTRVRLSKNLFGWFGGPQPSKCNPNPATCAADSEALRSKVSLHCFPPGRLIEPRGKQCKYSEKDAAGGLFRHAEAPDKTGACFVLFGLEWAMMG